MSKFQPRFLPKPILNESKRPVHIKMKPNKSILRIIYKNGNRLPSFFDYSLTKKELDAFFIVIYLNNQ